MEKSAWGQGSLGKVNIITLATLSPTPIRTSLVCPPVHVLPSGAKEDDYAVSEELNKVIVEESRTRAAAAETTDTSSTKAEAGEAAEAAETMEAGDVVSDTAAAKSEAKISSISFVSCATGEDAMQTLAGEQEAEEGEVTHLSCVLYFFVLFLFLFFAFQRVE